MAPRQEGRSSLAVSRKHLSDADQTSRPAPATKTPDSSRRFASGVPEQSLSVALARNYCVTLKATRVICMGSHAFPCSELLTAFARLKLIHRSCSQSTFVQEVRRLLSPPQGIHSYKVGNSAFLPCAFRSSASLCASRAPTPKVRVSSSMPASKPTSTFSVICRASAPLSRQAANRWGLKRSADRIFRL